MNDPEKISNSDIGQIYEVNQKRTVTMTIREVADIFGISERTIQEHASRMGLTKNGRTTYLTEEQVTAIKIKIGTGRNDLANVREVVGIKTHLEKALIVKQAIAIQQEMIEELQAENAELKPKAIQHDLFMSAENGQRIGDVAKILNIKPNTLHKMLRDSKILKENHAPYAGFEHFFKTIETPTAGGFNVFTSYLLPAGISYICKRFNLK